MPHVAHQLAHAFHDRQGWIVVRGQHLEAMQLAARIVERDQIGKRSADINANGPFSQRQFLRSCWKCRAFNAARRRRPRCGVALRSGFPTRRWKGGRSRACIGVSWMTTTPPRRRAGAGRGRCRCRSCAPAARALASQAGARGEDIEGAVRRVAVQSRYGVDAPDQQVAPCLNSFLDDAMMSCGTVSASIAAAWLTALGHDVLCDCSFDHVGDQGRWSAGIADSQPSSRTTSRRR